MILIPHSQQPIVEDLPATTEMRAWMQSVNSSVENNDFYSRFFVVVSVVEDLPSPISGVITLVDGYTYYFTDEVDLFGARIQAGRNSVILGASSENCRIKSTGLASALITSIYTLILRDITLESTVLFNLNATATAGQALNWAGVNLVSPNIGTITSYNNFIASSMAFLGSAGLVFDGTFGTIAIIQSLFSGDSGTIITIPSTATITRRIRINYCSFVVPSLGVGIDVSTSAAVPIEGYILDTVDFSGAGTYTQGVLFSDNKSRWIENRGITNSAAVTGYYMTNNATATTIASTGVPVKAAGTTTAIGITQRFSVSSNRATFSGSIARNFKLVALMTVTSGANHQIGLYIAKNGATLSESRNVITTGPGGRAEGGAVQAVTNLTSGDYLEIFVENNTSITDVTVVDLNVIVESLP